MKCSKCGHETPERVQDAFGRNFTVSDVMLYLRTVDRINVAGATIYMENSDAVRQVRVTFNKIEASPTEWTAVGQDIDTGDEVVVSGKSNTPTPNIYKLAVTMKELWP